MDPISLLVAVVRLAQITSSLILIQQNALTRDHGWVLGVLVSFFLRDTANRYERIDREVLNGSDKDAITFGQSVTNESNMTAIAGAIIAQVAVTALGLPNLSSTHWVARAFFLVAVTSGCLSVYYACVLQRIVGKFYQPEDIRNWLRAPPPRPKEKDDNEASDTVRASLPAVFILSAPFTAVKVSIFSFVIGLSIYQGFIWTENLDSSARPGDSRKIFITLMVVTGFISLFFLVTFSAKDIESILRFGKNHPVNRDSSRRFLEVSKADVAPHDRRKTDEEATTSPIHRQSNPRISTDRVIYANLDVALNTAAQAHARCAEADQQVALAYRRLYDEQIDREA